MRYVVNGRRKKITVVLHLLLFLDLFRSLAKQTTKINQSNTKPKTINSHTQIDQQVPSAGKTKPEAEQGLRWVKETLKVDADGDEAHEFLGPF